MIANIEGLGRLMAYVVSDSRGDIEFRDRAGFEEAMAGADPAATVAELSWSDDDPDVSRTELCEVRTADDWPYVVEAVRRHVRTMFMQGDCWHLALALNRLYGLGLAAVVNRHPDGRESVSHVAAALPDGGFLDVRGYLASEQDVSREGTNWRDHYVRPVSREEIVAILDGYAEENGGAAVDWEDPDAYPFAWQAELVARILLEEEAEGARPKSAPAR